MKKILLAIIAIVMTSAKALAFTGRIEVDGIKYDVDTDAHQASVVQKSPEYTGDVAIPASIVVEDVECVVTSIGDNAFSQCTSLTSITIPSSVTYIGNWAFMDCSSLSTIYIPPSVTWIGNNAFSGCYGLTAVHISDLKQWCGFRWGYGPIEDSSTNPLDYAHHLYLNGEEIKDLIIPEGVETICGGAFHGCTALTSVIFPSSLKYIQHYAFGDCTGLSSIDIPENVESVGSITEEPVNYYYGEGAFSGCTNIKSLRINAKDCSEFCFGLSNLESIIIGKNVENISESIYFQGTRNIQYIEVEAGNTTYDVRENCSAVIETSSNTLIAGYKSTVIPTSVTAIGNGAFSNCLELTSITIPNSVTAIGDRAFKGCVDLSSLEIPNSIKTIGSEAFYGCSGLSTVNIGNGIENIANDAFSECTNIETITINAKEISDWFSYSRTSISEIVLGDSVEKIGSGAFSNYKGLTSIDFGNNVDTIDNEAFYGCTGLTSVNIPNSVTSIGDYVFGGCIGLTSITIPNSVTRIGNGVFSRCSNLNSVIIPTSITSIGDYAFDRCTGLTSITIPPSITKLGLGAFQSCTNLNAVHITDISAWCNIVFNSNPLSFVHHLYLDEQEITDLVIPSTVSSINSIAFEGCTSLTSVIIEEGVTDIGEKAFSDCTGLTSISIPSSINTIGSQAFKNCSGLTTVTSFMVAPQIIGSNIFPEHLKVSGTLYVPANTRSIYVEKGWSLYFANIIEMDEVEPIWLSIIDQEQGRTDIRCKAGQAYTFRFNAPEGRHIQSVVFRGADVTDWLTEDGVFTTPAMSKSAELIVTYDHSPVQPSGDLNGDGQITIADVTKLVNIILGK